MINLTHMIFILNSVFTVVFYVARWTKLDITCIYFEEFINQLNLLYLCIYLYLQQNKSYGIVGPWTNFFCQPKFSTLSREWSFYIFLCFQFGCYFLYAYLICVYFKLQKTHHHSIILFFIIQSRSTVRGYQLVDFIFMALDYNVISMNLFTVLETIGRST
jgi:hypothetical protein